MPPAKSNRATAYSYLRFSTPDQMKGDSFRRQTELSQRYAEENGLDLDDKLTFRDLGVSAFRGKNIREGALGEFLKAVESGRVKPGAWLLVESLDRLSRDTVTAAFRRFSDILEKGITIVTLQDRKVYTAKSLAENFGDLMVSLGVMFRANEESATKSKRLKAAWQGKRKRVAEGREKLTAKAPTWLRLEGDTFTPIKDRAKVVQRVYKMASEGLGKVAIAKRLNAEKVPTFGDGKGWHPSSIQKLLESEAVFGVFQPMRLEADQAGKRKRVADGEPIRDYFPAIVSQEVYYAARKARQGRRIAVERGGDTVANLFTGLAVCGVCGAPMHYVNKGSGGCFLVCSNARRGVDGCKYYSWRYEPIEAFLLRSLTELDLSELFPDLRKQAETRVSGLNRQRALIEGKLSAAQAQREKAIDALVSLPKSQGLIDRLAATERTLGELQGELEKITREIASEGERQSHEERDYKDARAAIKALREAEGGALYDLRQRLAALLRRTIERAAFAPESDPQSPLHGSIVVAFSGSTLTRRVDVYRGWQAAESYTGNGKLLKVWKITR